MEDFVEEINIQDDKTKQDRENYDQNSPRYPDDNQRESTHPLSENPIYFYQTTEEKQFPNVPPPTPKELIIDCYVTVLPNIPDSVDDLCIPYVREHGVRDSIQQISEYFSCRDYKNNLVQFWFLDIIVDCIWKVQDEFRFPIEQQKVVLEWVLFIFKLVILEGMTRDLLFDIFNEALMIAEDYIQSGGSKQPTPKNLFVLKEEQDGEAMETRASLVSALSETSTTSLKVTQAKPSYQYVLIKYDQEFKMFKVPNKNLPVEDCLSSVDAPSEDGYQIKENVTESKSDLQSEVTKTNSSMDFIKVDMSTPPRFKSLQSLTKSEDDVSTGEESGETESENEKKWISIPRKEEINCPSKTIQEEISSKVDETNTKEDRSKKEEVLEEVFRAFYEYNLWQLEQEYTNDPNIGWISSLTKKTGFSKYDKTSKKEKHVQNKKHEGSGDIPQNIFVNSCVLLAVKDIVFDYFYINFCFELIKHVFKNPQFLITQDLNTEWNIPKDIKGDLKKPMPKKPKKEKPKKEKKEKKEKKSTKGKSTKGSKKDKSSKKSKSSKSTKKSKKSDKKSKKGSDKKSKSSSKKSTKLTKEEKAALEKERKEREEIERLKMKEEENKIFMFPLKEAVDDAFFAGIFPDYKPKKGKEKAGKKDKKGDKDKSSKKSKSSKK